MGASGNFDGEEMAQREVTKAEFVLNKRDLTVCDIIGDWGQYQWGLLLFALIYSALTGVVVVIGPIWTPDMNHICKSSLNYSATTGEARSVLHKNTTLLDLHECFAQQQRVDSEPALGQSTISNSEECSQFVYDDENYGKVLTNTVS